MRSQLTTIIALLVIGGLCGLALTQTYQSTRQPVTENRIRQAQALLSELLQRQAPTDLKWQQGVANACGDWQFVRGTSPGYAGPIDYLALLQDQQISLRVTRHQETPGIADFIDHRKDRYLAERDNTAIAGWAQLDNITGATITHEALRGMAAQAQTQLRNTRERYPCEQNPSEENPVEESPRGKKLGEATNEA